MAKPLIDSNPNETKALAIGERSMRRPSVKTICVGFFCALSAALSYGQQSPTITGCPAFPANSIWNTSIDTMPVSPHSADYIATISATGGLRYDDVIGITIVPGTQPKVPLNIIYPDESDPGPYPIPPDAKVEAVTDKHVIVVDQDNCMLYETYDSVLQPDGSWTVESAAKWSLLSNALRPQYWTSADAAGLPILPGLVRFEEVAAGEIKHALRFTTPHTQRLFVWPARHYASASTSATFPPMGQRFRLKADFDITPFSPQMQVILRALKKYGLILADNGLAWEMQFASDPRWDEQQLLTLRNVAGSNFEAVDVSPLMIDPDSGEADQKGGVKVNVSPATATLGPGQTAQFNASVVLSNQGVVWSVNPAVGTVSASGFYTAPSTVTGSQTVTVTASLADGSRSGSASIVLQPTAAAKLTSVTAAPSIVIGGSAVSVTVTLTLPAPAGDAVVNLTGSNAAFPSASVRVPAGTTSQTFSLPTANVPSTTTVNIIASYNGDSLSSPALTISPAPPSGTAEFVKSDSTTGGSWKGVYGGDGYNIVSNNVQYPSYVTVTVNSAGTGTWVASTGDPRALQKADSNDRIAGHWYSPTSFSLDLNFKDSATHQVAVYLLDWDYIRSELVEVLDTHNYVLDSRPAANFHNGLYLVWNLSGQVRIRITNSNPATNAVVSGLFFGGAGSYVPGPPPPPTGTASFVNVDNRTAGNWKGVYGSDGYNIIGNKASYPAYVSSAAMSGGDTYVWAASSTDPGALQKADGPDRIGAQWFSSTFNIELYFSDAGTHRLSLYLYDPESIRAETVEILDANYTLLDSQAASSFTTRYLSWNVNGHLIVRVSTTNANANATVSGLFFDPPAPPVAASQ